MKKLLFFSCFAALWLARVGVAAPLAIAGTAVNATINRPLAGVEVKLVSRQQGSERRILAAAKTDAAGRFAFAPRENQPQETLAVETRHGGFDYWKIAYFAGRRVEKLRLDTYDTTKQALPLQLLVHHLALESKPDGLKCIERMVVQNPSKKTQLGIGPRGIALWFNLPKAAQNVRLDPKISEAKLVKTSSGWGVVRAPIPPDDYLPEGKRVGFPNLVIVNYEMPWPSKLPWAKKIDLSRVTSYATQFFFVARTTEDKNLQIVAPSLSPDKEEQLPMGDTNQTRVVNMAGAAMGGPALTAQTNLQIVAERPVNPLFWGFAALTVALCLFLPLAMVKPRRGASTLQRAKSLEPGWKGSVIEQSSAWEGSGPRLNGFGTDFAFSSQSRDLIQQIAGLDDEHEAGKIDEATYQARRAAWKKQLIESLGSRSDE